jgi:hypothetical protein
MPHNFKARLEIKMIRDWFSGLIVFALSINPAVAENGTGTDMSGVRCFTIIIAYNVIPSRYIGEKREWLLTGKV